MPDTPEDWRRVWAAIDERRNELGMTRNELYERGRVSQKTLRKMAAGTPLVSDSKRRSLEAALRWKSPAIDRILQGLSPEPVPDRLPSAAFLRSADVQAMRNALAHNIEIPALQAFQAQLASQAAAVLAVQLEDQIAPIVAHLHSIQGALGITERVSPEGEREFEATELDDSIRTLDVLQRQVEALGRAVVHLLRQADATPDGDELLDEIRAALAEDAVAR